MKTLLQIKIWLVLILSGFLTIVIVSSCSSSSPGTVGGRTTTTSGSSGTGRSRGATLTCKLPSGNGSCEKNDKCVKWCEDNDYLDLSGDARDKCLDLNEKTVEDLVFLFDDVFEKPDDEKLDDLKKEDLELICAAVKELDHDVLADRLNYSSSARAQYVTEWVAKTKGAIEIFENVKKKGEGLKMFKKLISRAGTGSGTDDDDVLEGLAVNVASDSDEDTNVLRVALDENNNGLVSYIHNDIIADEDEICSGSNQPVPNSGCTPTGVTNSVDYDASATGATGFKEESCILAVYCKIAPGSDDDDDNEFRKDMSAFLKNRNIAKFIEEEISSGGLGLTENDADDWTGKVCEHLRACWNDSSSLALGL